MLYSVQFIESGLVDRLIRNFLKLISKIWLAAAMVCASVCARAQGNAVPVIVGTLQSPILNEISGIAASQMHKGILYIHNDSGDKSRFFAITPQGVLKTIYNFRGDKSWPSGVGDCEDIAVGVGPLKGHSYIYLGDIGDNSASRKYITVYRFDEAALQPGAPEQTIRQRVAVNLKYPDGARDAETLMIDSVAKLLYIISKREDSVGVYVTALSFKPDDTIVLQKKCTLYFKGPGKFKWITAGDISPDGQQVLLKSYNKVYYWQRKKNEPIWVTMQREPKQLPYTIEAQGEAICFETDGKNYYTTSEGVRAPIYFYPIR
jgi:hypothetical protein